MNNTAKNLPRMTAEEYFRYTPETNQACELIDGEVVALASPSLSHQRISGEIYSAVSTHIRANHGNWWKRL